MSSEEKTLQQIVRPITLRCGSPGCSASCDAVATSSVGGKDDGKGGLVAPRGWTFDPNDPRSTRDVMFGACPAHPKP
jgi:hypothetical protein